jgi:hypothetical protein
MTRSDAAPHPLGQQDAQALIGLVAILEGHLLGGDLDPQLAGSLTVRLQEVGLVGPGGGPPELRLVLADLNQRLRYVLGEYDEPPASHSGGGEMYFGFAAQAAARAFVDAARAQGESAAAPVAVDGRAYDGEVSWEVAVGIVELPLSVRFDQHEQRLSALAAGHGGASGGWGSRAV